MPVLKTKGYDPDEELEFELEYQATLTTQERLEMMFSRSRELKELLVSYGHRKPVTVIKRK